MKVLLPELALSVCTEGFSHEIDELSRAVALRCAERAVLFKRTTHNLVRPPTTMPPFDATLEVLDGVLGTLQEGVT